MASFLTGMIPDSVKGPVTKGVSNAFNNHPKVTAITLIVVGTILTVGMIALSIHTGGNPFSLQYMTVSILPIGIGFIGVSLGLHLFLKGTGHKKAAHRVMWTVIPILGAIAGGLIFGHGFMTFFSGNATMTTFYMVAGGGIVVGISLEAFGKHGLGDYIESAPNKRGRNQKARADNRNLLQRAREAGRRRMSQMRSIQFWNRKEPTDDNSLTNHQQ